MIAVIAQSMHTSAGGCRRAEYTTTVETQEQSRWGEIPCLVSRVRYQSRLLCQISYLDLPIVIFEGGVVTQTTDTADTTDITITDITIILRVSVSSD